MYRSLPSLTHLTLLSAIISISIFLAVNPQLTDSPLYSQVCFISGVSIPLNLIFSPFKCIVSPSMILISIDLTSLYVRKKKYQTDTNS